MRHVLLWVCFFLGCYVWLAAVPVYAIEPRGYIGKGQSFATPYYVIEGAKEGPTIVVVGGTHGDELAGWQAAEQLLHGAIDCGRLVVIPQANIRSVRQNVREVPDEGNLNRAYPGKSDGLLTERLALEILELIRSYQPVMVLDLHESYGFYSEGFEYLGQTIICYVDQKSNQLAYAAVDKMNPRISEEREQFTVVPGPVPGSTAYAVGRYLEIPGFTIETTERMPLEERIYYQLLVVQTMLKEAGVTLTCNPHS